MANKFFFLFALAIIPSIIFGQDNDRYQLDGGFYGGFSVPIGKFSDNQSSDWAENCSCANTYGAFGMKFQYRVKNNLFGVFGIQHTWNGYPAQPLAESLNEEFDIPISVDTKGWKSETIQFGGSFNFPVKRTWFGVWDISLEATGVLNVLETFSYKVSSPDGSKRYPLRQYSEDDIGIGYSMGAEISLNINYLVFKITANYLTSSHSINGVTRRYNGGDSIEVSYNQKIELLLVQAGITFRF